MNLDEQDGCRDPRTSPTRTRRRAVVLHSVAISDRASIRSMVIDPEQEQFAGSVDAIFDQLQSSRHPESEHPFAIVDRGTRVGFFILREKHATPDWAPHDVVTLHSFRICRASQGQGFGRAGVELAISWIRQNRPNAKRLMLAVNALNMLAKAVYLNCGFIDTRTVVVGPIGKQHILAIDIARDCG
jgi:RimJ/RimL family protein N-acetyltransferase